MKSSAGRLEVWYDGGAWRWLYRDPVGDLVLLGNRSHPSRPAAVASARLAYPQAPIARRPGHRGSMVRTLVAAALGGLGAGAALASGRRRRTKDGIFGFVV